MLTVSELARQSHTTPDAIRYYTRIGILRPQRNPRNSYRLYRKKDVQSLRFLQKANYLGYTLDEISMILHDADKRQSACPRVRQILEARINKSRAELKSKLAFQEKLEEALKRWKNMPDGIPDGKSVCYLIESMSTENTVNMDSGINFIKTRPLSKFNTLI